MIGWVSVRPSLDLGAWVLFGILFTWQMPHFLAIAWMYRDEYAQAGFVMLRRDDLSGCATAMQSLLYTFALSIVTLIPYFCGSEHRHLSRGRNPARCRNALLRRAIPLPAQPPQRPPALLCVDFFLPLILGLMVLTKA